MADYDLKLGAVDVDLGGLGPLGDMASNTQHYSDSTIDPL